MKFSSTEMYESDVSERIVLYSVNLISIRRKVEAIPIFQMKIKAPRWY